MRGQRLERLIRELPALTSSILFPKTMRCAQWDGEALNALMSP
jgi:hypothetical protein